MLDDGWEEGGGWDEWGGFGGDDPLHLPHLAAPLDSQAHAAAAAEPGSEGGEGLVAWRFARPAPTQAELEASCWDVGVPPVVAPRAHYGQPRHAPTHMTVFAGREFR